MGDLFYLLFNLKGQQLSTNRVDFQNQRGLIDLYTKFGENYKLTLELCDGVDSCIVTIGKVILVVSTWSYHVPPGA